MSGGIDIALIQTRTPATAAAGLAHVEPLVREAAANGARFILTPEAVEITQGSAVGASLGISFAGLYLTASERLDLQGVVSPIYLVNGVGQIFSRPGEGLFGFNYRVTGTAEDPQVSVNPLSVFTPGMFREIFRRAPPNLKDAG